MSTSNTTSDLRRIAMNVEMPLHYSDFVPFYVEGKGDAQKDETDHVAAKLADYAISGATCVIPGADREAAYFYGMLRTLDALLCDGAFLPTYTLTPGPEGFTCPISEKALNGPLNSDLKDAYIKAFLKAKGHSAEPWIMLDMIHLATWLNAVYRAMKNVADRKEGKSPLPIARFQVMTDGCPLNLKASPNQTIEGRTIYPGWTSARLECIANSLDRHRKEAILRYIGDTFIEAVVPIIHATSSESIVETVDAAWLDIEGNTKMLRLSVKLGDISQLPTVEPIVRPNHVREACKHIYTRMWQAANAQQTSR